MGKSSSQMELESWTMSCVWLRANRDYFQITLSETIPIVKDYTFTTDVATIFLQCDTITQLARNRWWSIGNLFLDKKLTDLLTTEMRKGWAKKVNEICFWSRVALELCPWFQTDCFLFFVFFSKHGKKNNCLVKIYFLKPQ